MPAETVVWLPFLAAGTGSEVFTYRLRDALNAIGYRAQIQRFSKRWEPFPRLLSRVAAPPGTRIVIANSWNAVAFKRPDVPLVTVFHHCVQQPALQRHFSIAQRSYHALRITPLEQAALRISDRCVAPSRFTARLVGELFGVPRPAVVPNGIETDLYRPATNSSAGSGSVRKPFQLVFLGKDSVRKGIDLISPTMESLGPQFALSIVGGRPKHRFPANVSVLGRVPTDEIIRILQHADALLFPSRMEGFGYAVAESMSCGTPAIALRRGAIPELITHEVNGLLCDDEDPAALARAACRLAENPVLLRRLGENARSHAESQFSMGAFGLGYHKQVASLLA